jgi:methylenetetrahydrofolate reductase (NADPH)
MHIDPLFSERRITTSFEFFPPRSPDAEEALWKALSTLKSLSPDFVSITRTGGGTGQTVDLTVRMQAEIGLRAMSHLTCVHHSRDEMAAHLDELWARGIRNVLALRGDLEPGNNPDKSDFSYASDLVRFVRERHPFSIGVAGYPEGHPQCLNVTRDLEHLRRKIDLGASFVITQLFFDDDTFLNWRDEARRMGVRVPIVAGIMPITNVAQIKRFVTRCGAKIPHALLMRLEAVEDDPAAVLRVGHEHALAQCRRLEAEGVDGLHFYTLNRSKATANIVKAMRGTSV